MAKVSHGERTSESRSESKVRGEELTSWLVRYGYCRGAFPMTDEGGRIQWYQPRKRAILPIEGMRLSRSMRRFLSRRPFDVTFDSCFERVMRECRRPEANWINEDLIRVYTQIHMEGWGHSVECWRDAELVGGLYGIVIGGCFCAESMFHRATNASKVALYSAVERCRDLGFIMFDVQVLSPHLASLGAIEIDHAEYMCRLAKALAVSTPWSR